MDPGGQVPYYDRALAFRLARRECFRLVYTAHNLLPHERFAGQAARYRRLYQAAGGLIVHAQASRARLLALLGDPDARIDVIPMPADQIAAPVDPQVARAWTWDDAARASLLAYDRTRARGMSLAAKGRRK